jgi:hypothetical protein
MLSPGEKQKVEEAVIERLGHSAVKKGELLKLGASYEQTLRLNSDSVASIKALVSVYVDQRSFEKAVELQTVLNYHHELDLGYEDDATREGMSKLATIYKMQAATQLSELDRAEKDDNTAIQLAILLRGYYETQSDLVFLYSGIGDLEAGYAIQAEALAMVNKFNATNDRQEIDLEARAMAELAKIAKFMGKTNEAISLLKNAREYNRKAGSRKAGSGQSRQDFDNEMATALQVWGRELDGFEGINLNY